MQPKLKFASDITVKDGVITAVLSTESVDRDGDIVPLDGWDLSNFTKSPRLMSCHDYGDLRKQIGEWRNVHVDQNRKALVGEPHYYVNQGNPEADWAYFLATQGQATYSVGFNPLESEPRKGGGGSVYLRKELLECSHVPVPAQPEALQLMLKAATWKGGVHKWESNYMPGSDPSGWGPIDTHCIVAGCDDASQTSVPICSEHLKYLMNSDPEPKGSPLDGDEPMMMALNHVTRSFRRVAKSGRQISAGNMGKLHTALQSLHDVHDSSCTADDCPLDDSGDGGDPPTARDKSVKATICPFCHPKSAVNTDDPADCKCASDCGESKCPKAEKKTTDAAIIRAIVLAELEAKSHSELPDSAFACIDPGGDKDDGKTRPLSLRHYPHHTASGAVDDGLLRAALSRIGDPSNEQCGKAHLEAHAKAEGIGENADKAFEAERFTSSLEDAMTKALEVAGW